MKENKRVFRLRKWEKSVWLSRSGGCIWALTRAVFLLGMAFIILYPLLYMISMAVRPVAQLHDPAVVWFPKSVTLENILDAMDKMGLSRPLFNNNALVNSVVLDVVSATLQMLVTAMIGYGFARFEFKGKTLMFGVVILSIIVPVNSIIIPTYLNYRFFDLFGITNILGRLIKGSPIYLPLVDNMLSFYLPALLGSGIRSGLCIFIYRQFFKGMPRELEDAAAIDNCGAFATFFRIFLPNARPPMLTVFVLSLVWYWSDYYYSSMFFPSFRTVSIGLSQLQSAMSTDVATRDPYRELVVMQSGALIAIIPLLIFYLFIQRRFTESVERSGIVG